MSATRQGQALAGYRDAVTEQLRAGDSFGEIEHAIDGVADLTTDQKAALWLFAFSLHGRAGRRATRGLTWPPSSS